MHLRALGTSGLTVSAIGLGCMGLSANYGEPVDGAASGMRWRDRSAGFRRSGSTCSTSTAPTPACSSKVSPQPCRNSSSTAKSPTSARQRSAPKLSAGPTPSSRSPPSRTSTRCAPANPEAEVASMRRAGHRTRPLEPARPGVPHRHGPPRPAVPGLRRGQLVPPASPPMHALQTSRSSTQSARSPPGTTARQPRSHSPGSSPSCPGSCPSPAPGAAPGNTGADSISLAAPPSSTEPAAAGRATYG